MQLWWNISIQWYSRDNGPPNHCCIMMCCFTYNGRIWHLPSFSSDEASDVGRVVWRDQGVAGALQLGLQPSHLEFRQLEEDTRLHMAGVNGEITWGKPVCEHLMVWLYWLYWFMKACAEISHQGSVQRMFHRHAKKNRHQIIERKSLISHLLWLIFLLKNSQRPLHLLWEGDEKDSLQFWLWIGSYFPT